MPCKSPNCWFEAELGSTDEGLVRSAGFRLRLEKGMRWLKLTLAYDGGAYAGWQVQPDQPTVQAALAQAWTRITGEKVNMTAAGRTDAGVHALGQVVGITTDSRLGHSELAQGLNAKLPDDVVVGLDELLLVVFSPDRQTSMLFSR